MSGRPKPRSREAELRDEIERYAELALEAREAAAYTPAVTAVQRLASARVELRRISEAKRVARLRDPVRRLERMSQLALAEGSFVAAEKLASRAQVLQAERDAIEREQQLQDRAALSTDELLRILIDSVQHLPAQDVETLLGELQDRLR